MSSERFLATEELLGVVNAMLGGDEDLIEGVRKVCLLRMKLDPDSEVFIPIRAIDSETDHFPGDAIRRHYGTAALAKFDEEKRRYLEAARDDLLAACLEIARVYGH